MYTRSQYLEAILRARVYDVAAETPLENRRTTGGKSGLRNIELVGVHRPLDEKLAEAKAGSDEHGIVEAGLRVDRERHAG